MTSCRIISRLDIGRVHGANGGSLDLIAQGKKDKVEFLSNYYLGSDCSSDSTTNGLLNKVKEKLGNKEIDHMVSRTLAFPPLEGM